MASARCTIRKGGQRKVQSLFRPIMWLYSASVVLVWDSFLPFTLLWPHSGKVHLLLAIAQKKTLHRRVTQQCVLPCDRACQREPVRRQHRVVAFGLFSGALQPPIWLQLDFVTELRAVVPSVINSNRCREPAPECEESDTFLGYGIPGIRRPCTSFPATA